MPAFFISGIDTGIGKTIITGLIARYLLNTGKSVITQKFVQTGCSEVSEDIILHRKIMGIELMPEDNNGLTCPYIFNYPSSPHLASNLEGKVINPKVIKSASEKLIQNFEYLLIEGAGGLHVPLKIGYTTLDYIQANKYPLILVSSPKLGSINHTLLSLETAKKRKIEVKGIIYNLYPPEEYMIVNNTREVFKYYLGKFGYPLVVIDIPFIKDNAYPEIDFSPLF
jgi:dethiobiotin synthetase